MKLRNIQNTIYKILQKFRVRTWIAFGIILILLPIALVALNRPSTTEAVWFDDDWLYRKEIRIRSGVVNGSNNLIDFPYLITTTSDSDLSTNAQADGDDIVFTDEDGNVWAHEIEAYSSGTLTAWVKIPTLYHNQDTVLYMYYGNASVSAQESPSSVWGGNYRGVWHMNDSSGTTIVDSSAAGKNGTKPGASTPAYTASGKINGAQDFANNTHIAVASPNLPTGDFTYQAWIQLDAVNDERLFHASNGSSSINELSISIGDCGTGELCHQMNGIGGYTAQTQAILTTSTWYHVAIVRSGSLNQLFVNGNLEGTGTDGVALDFGSCDFVIGADVDSGCTGGLSNYLDGRMDEARVIAEGKSADWIKTEYNNQSNPQASYDIDYQVSVQLGQATSDDWMTDGLVGYWKMDESSANSCTGGSNDSCDSSGNGNDAAWQGNATTTTSGRYDRAITLDGTGDYATVPDAADLDITDSITMMAWVNGAVLNNYHRIIAKMTSGEATGYMIDSVAGQSKIRIRINSSECITDAAVLTTGAWYHVAATYDVNNMNIYIDGELVKSCASTAPSITANNEVLAIGNRSDNNAPWNGRLDEVRVYNRALSSQEINTLYLTAPGPTIHWAMNEGTGTTSVSDSSGNGYNIAMNNMTQSNWVTGKYSYGLDFDGSTDSLTMSDNPVFTQDTLTWEFWFKIDQTSIAKGADQVFIEHNHNSDPWTAFLVFIPSWTNNLHVNIGDSTNTLIGLSSTTSVTTSTWYHVAVVLEDSTVKLYLNGSLEDQENFTNAFIDGSAGFSAGAGDDGFGFYQDGQLDDIRFYNYARTQAQIVLDMNNESIESVNGLPRPVAHYGFDEGNGQIANNKSQVGGSALNGTLGANSSPSTDDPQWKNNVDCKVNGCLSFDGTNDFATADGVTSTIPTVPFTITGWVYPDDAGRGTVFSFHNSSANGNMLFWSQDGSSAKFSHFSTIAQYVDSASSFATNQWHHVAWAIDGEGEGVLYVNGIQQAAWSGSDEGTVNQFSIGQEWDTGTPSDFFDGNIDEVKIYDVVLTADQVKVDMNASSATSFGVLGSSESSEIVDGPGNPPVLWWSFDENTGSSINDKSSSNNVGTITGATFTPGKFGSAIRFSTTDTEKVEDASPTNIPANNAAQSISYWYRVDSNPTGPDVAVNILGAGSSALQCGIRSSTIMCWKNGGTELVNAGMPAAGQWVHVTFTTTGSSHSMYINGQFQESSSVSLNTGSATEVQIGYNGDSTTEDWENGEIDEVKIWDYALTQAQVAYEYNRGAPVVHWKMDECTGTTLYDSSGNGINATIVPGASGNTSAGTCSSGTSTEMWNDGTDGKYNGSLGFDGANDHATFSRPAALQSIAGQGSIAGWVKLENNDGTLRTFIDVAGTGTTGLGMFIQTLSCSGGAGLQYGNGSSTSWACYSTPLSTGTWYHLAGTWNSSGAKLYLNGKLVGTNATAPAISFSTGTGYIGSNTASLRYLHGQADDLRIYNYELSESQIKKLMNESSATRFGTD